MDVKNGDRKKKKSNKEKYEGRGQERGEPDV